MNRIIKKRQGYKIGCIEEIAFRKGFISRDQLNYPVELYIKSGYGVYLKRIK